MGAGIAGSMLRALPLAAGLAAAPALAAETDTLGPVSVSSINCGEKFTLNLMIFNCASPAKCDYALGVNDFSGAPLNYTLTVDAPPNYPVYAKGPRTSKDYDAFKIVQAPQSASGPKVRITFVCTHRN